MKSKKKILLKISSYIVVFVIGMFLGHFGIKWLWGQAESQLEKTEVQDNAPKVESESGVELSDMNNLTGTFKSEEGEDVKSSEIAFFIDGIESTKGRYKKFDIDLTVPEDYTQSQLDVVIDAASIYTANRMRDEGLREKDFFNVAEYPQITFSSNEFLLGDTSYVANGTFNMMGTEKPLAVHFLYKGTGTNDNNQEIAVFEGKFVFDRTEHGMSETTSVGNIVEVKFYTELIKQ